MYIFYLHKVLNRYHEWYMPKSRSTILAGVISRRSTLLDARKRSNGKVGNDNFFLWFFTKSYFWVVRYELSHGIMWKEFVHLNGFWKQKTWLISSKIIGLRLQVCYLCAWYFIKWHTWKVQIQCVSYHILWSISYYV